MRTILTCTLVLLTVTAVASADLEEHSTNYAFPLSPGFQTVSLPEFNTLGGTRVLDFVELCLFADIQADVTVENDSVLDAPDYELSLTGLTDATAQVGSLGAGAGIADVWGVALLATDGNPGSGPDFHDFGTLMSSDFDDDFTFATGPYEGLGTFDVLVDGSAGFAFNGTTDSTLVVSNLQASGEVKVKYNFHVIPEPATLSLLAFGGLMLIRRRR